MAVKDDYIIGLDYGAANIGMALGKSGTVSPIRTIPSKNIQSALHDIIRFGIENKAIKFVLGLPLDAENKDTKQSAEVRRFAKKLKILSKKPVEFQDEFATTIEAEEEMIELSVSQKRRRVKDHYSAALILTRFYNR